LAARSNSASIEPEIGDQVVRDFGHELFEDEAGGARGGGVLAAKECGRGVIAARNPANRAMRVARGRLGDALGNSFQFGLALGRVGVRLEIADRPARRQR
jgi:hypothetical protein